MDVVSHALWGGVSFGRTNKKNFLLAAGISVLPDVLTEGLFFVLSVAGVGGMPSWERGHPNITDYPMFAQNLYNVTHSIVVFAFAFGLLTIAFRRPVWVVAAWGLHVLIDMPTHSAALFPTPFLWPISDLRIDGIGWDHPAIWAVDLVLLIAAYALWLNPKFQRNR
jgi:membrane-bound metal-dependent hydrolase YbcI (DUF457 family)